MKEKLMVRGKKFWIADKECKVLVSYHDSKNDAREALVELEKHERREGYYIPYYYKIVEGVLGALKLQGYTPLDDIWALSDM